ncbi:MAG: LLM class F420-dependent oxidoreductase [Anaerolinea sp.]|nr:LLM class F420-dependent oxidoreductase [Anaerolinea sp.]
MKIGVVFPQTEFGSDPVAIRDYAQTAESLGYTHILAYDHILGANPDRPGGWQGPYTYQTPFHEPFVLFGFMAGATQTIEFVTGVIILPQRETAVVAKQAATLDVLSNGRFRLGVGIGWNEVEYVALNQEFKTRGKRIEEQVELLQLLWQYDLVIYNGRWHTIPDAGINPLPIQRPIPLWFGGHADAVLQRIAKAGAGWLPNYRDAARAKPEIEKLAGYLAENGRSLADIGIEFRLGYGSGDPAAWAQTIADWQAAGATHMSLNTMGLGFTTPQQHLDALRHFAAHVADPTATP